MRLHALPVLAWILAVLTPFWLAWNQLDAVAERSIWETLLEFEGRFQTAGALRFTFVIASSSALATVAIGLPSAWALGRHHWPGHSLVRGLLTAPFVMPSILAAMGFLALIDLVGLLIEFDMRGSEEARLWSLVLAHVWFNLALVIRFTEPLLATLDPSLEAAARLLPGGRTRWGRLRRFWTPLLAPAVAAAGALSFVFSFTSFALVRWLTPGHRNLEVVMANQSTWAGIDIPAFGRVPSEIVLAASAVQLLTILLALGLASRLQAKVAGQRLATHADGRSPAPLKSVWTGVLGLTVLFVVAPLAGLVGNAFLVLENGALVFSTLGWEAAFGGSRSDVDVTEALGTSVFYALTTLAVALPWGYLLADAVHRLEATRPRLALCLDLAAMLPLALSAVMIGLGVLLGLIRTDPLMAREWWVPITGHVLLTVPFVVRVLLPAMRALDPDVEAAAALLGAGPVQRLLRVRLPMLRPGLVVAASLVLAISLGEFGASMVVLRFTEWTTLPVMIDGLLGVHGYDPVRRTAAAAAGTVLLGLTMVLFMAVERFRPLGRGGMF